MNEETLANGLVTLKGHDLRMIYSILFKTNLKSTISTKTKDILYKNDQDHFMRYLQQEIKQLENKKDIILKVDIMQEITRLADVKDTKYNHPEEIKDQFSYIIDKVYTDLQKRDKKFHDFISSEPNTERLDHLLKYQMTFLLDRVDKKFELNTEEEQAGFVNQIEYYIDSLPEEKQSKIKETLGTDQLSKETLNRTIATSGAGFLLGLIVEVSGFAFFTSATSLLAATASLIGITIPFGVYTGLTSFIAVLGNPLFLIPFLLGGGSLYLKHQNSVLVKRLLPIILIQIALAYRGKDTQVIINQRSFIIEWEKRFSSYCNYKNQIVDLKKQQERIKLEIKSRKKEFKSITKIIEDKEKQVEKADKYKIAFSKIDLSKGEKNNSEYSNLNSSEKLHRKKIYRLNINLKKLKNSKKKKEIEIKKLDELEQELKQEIYKNKNAIQQILKRNRGFEELQCN